MGGTASPSVSAEPASPGAAETTPPSTSGDQVAAPPPDATMTTPPATGTSQGPT
jgi:hypothetical protein